MARPTPAQLRMLGHMVKSSSLTIMPRGRRWATAGVLLAQGLAVDVSGGLLITSKGLEVLKAHRPDLSAAIAEAEPLILASEKGRDNPNWL